MESAVWKILDFMVWSNVLNIWIQKVLQDWSNVETALKATKNNNQSVAIQKPIVSHFLQKSEEFSLVISYCVGVGLEDAGIPISCSWPVTLTCQVLEALLGVSTAKWSLAAPLPQMQGSCVPGLRCGRHSWVQLSRAAMMGRAKQRDRLGGGPGVTRWCCPGLKGTVWCQL